MAPNSNNSKSKQFLARRRTAYIKTFESPFADEVLADLGRFCRSEASTFHADARIHAVLEGRREVWLRISQHLKLSDEELYALYNGPSQTTMA